MIESRMRQPGFSRGRGYAGGAGRAVSKDSMGSGGGSLPPINDRSVSRDAMLPRVGGGRTRSIGPGDSTAQVGKIDNALPRDNSLPPLLRPRATGNVGDAQQSVSSRPPRQQVTSMQVSQSQRSTGNQESIYPQQEPIPQHQSGIRSRPPKGPESDSPLSKGPANKASAARARSGSHQRTDSPLTKARPNVAASLDSPRSVQKPTNRSTHARGDARSGTNNHQRGTSRSTSSAYPRDEDRSVQSGTRPHSPPVPALAHAGGRPPSPPIPTLAGHGPVGEPVNADVDEISLCPCRHCGRKFRPEALVKHEKICVKVFQKERKKFKTIEQRLPDEALKIQQDQKRAERRQGKKSGAPGAGKQNEDAKIPSNWRLRSEAFRRAMAESRAVTRCQKEGKSLRDLPPPKASPPELDDRVPCPHCGRRFGQQQAERHIPKCKETKAKPNGPLRAHAAVPKSGSAPRAKPRP